MQTVALNRPTLCPAALQHDRCRRRPASPGLPPTLQLWQQQVGQVEVAQVDGLGLLKPICCPA